MAKLLALVTGACGFVGSHFIDQLLQHTNYSVRAMDLPEADCQFLNRKVEFVPGDLRNSKTLARAVEDVNVVFHVASLFRYSASYDDLYAVNVEGTRNLCHEMIAAHVSKFVLISSAGVYGIPQSLPVTEQALPNPSNAYEQSKLEQEQAAQKICAKSDVKFVILRPAPIYGPRNRYGIGTILRMVALGQLPIISKNLNTLVPLVHVADVVGAALHLVSDPTAVGQVYNVVDDSTYRKYELFTYLAPLLDAKIYYTRFPLLPRWLLNALASWSEWKARHFTHKEPKIERATIDLMYHDYWYSNAKLKGTGYQLLYPDSRIGLEEIIEWYKQSNWLVR
ncbi:MAG: NAD-dependent epimerase/dehydratase family protein [Candidatus Thorarchaeota archaeon]